MQAGTKTKVTLFSRSPSDRSRKIFQNSLTPLSPVPFYLFIYLFIYHSLSWRIILVFLFFFSFISFFLFFLLFFPLFNIHYRNNQTNGHRDTRAHLHTCARANGQNARTHGRTDKKKIWKVCIKRAWREKRREEEESRKGALMSL